MHRGLTRRSLLTGAGTAGVGLLLGRPGVSDELLPTPRQIEGPFYPVAEQADKDVDLTQVQGHAQAARGTRLLLEGSVRTIEGAPVPGALVEIWQACATGRYNHPRDRNPAALDPDFQYWGRLAADASGGYRFKSIKPGAYPNTPDWKRPPHIHFRVIAPGFRSLTTQMYFEGEDLNARDRLLQNLAPAERRMLTVAFEAAPGGADQLAGRFDIVVGPEAQPGTTPQLD